eukprot:5611509-Amphidinium_carterae.1
MTKDQIRMFLKDKDPMVLIEDDAEEVWRRVHIWRSHLMYPKFLRLWTFQPLLWSLRQAEG